jgi:MFS family permease
MIASSTDTHLRGRAFGFHRALDHAGAVVGPLIAFMLLGWGMELHSVFIISVVPGILVVTLIIFGLPDKPVITVLPKLATKLRWHEIDVRLRALIIATGGISLATMPEVFLVLWAQSRGLEIVWVPLLWAAASAIKVVIAIPGGYAADHFGRLPVLIIGWSTRVIVLIFLAFSHSSELTIWLLFLAYAASIAMTEGAELALIGDYSPEGKKATAFGIYHMISGLLLLPGAVLFGLLWQWFGESSAFFTSAGLIALSLLVLIIITFSQEKQTSEF